MSYEPDRQAPFEQALQAQGYVPLPEFAVLDECEFYDSKTRQKVNLDRDRLEKMAKAQNDRIEGRNDATPIIVGHTKDDAKEEDQPEIVGYATRFHVGNLPDGKAAIFARPWAKPDEVETFRLHPRRSVELWLDPDAIDPIAILGATTPRRDLGLHLFGRAYAEGNDKTTTGSSVRFCRSSYGRQPILFEMRENTVDKQIKCEEPVADDPTPPGSDTSPTGDDAAVEKVMNSDWGKRLTAFLDKFEPILDQVLQEEEGAMGPDGGAMPPGAGGPPGAGSPPPGAGAGAAPPPPGAGAMPPDAGAPPEADSPPLPDREDGPIKKNSAGYSLPGAGTTAMPNYFDRAGYEAQVRLQRLETEYVANQKRVADQMVQLQRENAALKLARIEDEVRGELDALTREGYTVVESVDFPHLCKLSREERAKAVKFMRDTRVKKDTSPLPGAGREVIPTTEQLIPLQFSRPTGDGLAADPTLVPATAGEPTYEQLCKMAGEYRRQGKNPLNDYDAGLLRAAPDGDAVKVR
jgi:hypothetical protein